MSIRMKAKTLSSEERKALLECTVCECPRVAERARVVLLFHDGERTARIIARTGLSRPTVCKWIRCYTEKGIEGLKGERSPGRPPVYREELVAILIQAINVSPRSCGISSDTWTIRQLEQYLNASLGISIRRSRIHEVLQENGYRWTMCSGRGGEWRKNQGEHCSVDHTW